MGNPTVGVRGGGSNPGNAIGNGETMIGVVCTGLAKAQPLKLAGVGRPD